MNLEMKMKKLDDKFSMEEINIINTIIPNIK